MGKRPTPARLLALDVVTQVRLRDGYVRDIFDARRAGSALAPEELAFAQVLAFGSVMCRGTLDEALDRSLSKPSDIKAKVRDCLRISAYELLFLGKPAHVVVDQGVELVRSRAPRAAGLANAVLRKMVCDAGAFPWADPAADPAAFARSFGMPQWLSDCLVSQYGISTAQAVLNACLKAAPTYLHANPFKEGTEFPADLSSAFTASLVDSSGPVLEVGAGRGTKTLLIQKGAYERSGTATRVDAVELHEYRVRLLEQRMEEMGVPDVHAHAADARDLSGVEGLLPAYGSVFVDAPCTGTGTMRRHPEIRWRLQPGDVESLCNLQQELLGEAAGRVAGGGTLVYATCSLLERENEHVVERFLASVAGKGFSIERIEPFALVANEGWKATPQGFFAGIPLEGGPDGHFAAVLRKG